MKKHVFLLLTLLLGINFTNAHPVNQEKAKAAGLKFACAKFNKELKSNDLSLVYTGTSLRSETSFYVFNTGEKGFVIVSADDRFLSKRPDVKRIGICFDFQLVDEVPAEPFDIRMDEVITL